ncbi:hypothetical protein VE00_05026 [Pseudogymnoascus sp. WSF 3629]|nr:hypothetical protein VE00_05026 [Pseudogymnoascus sp. WSF 3629]
MEAEQLASKELSFFHRDNVRFKTLKGIIKSISELYISMKDSYSKFEKRHPSRELPQDPRYTVGELMVCNKADARKAEKLVARLHSEMRRINERVEEGVVKEVNDQKVEVVGSYDMRRDMERYSGKWVEALGIIEKIFGAFVARGEQIQKYWNEMEIGRLALIEEMVDETQGGTDLFNEILTLRLEKFGIEEVEDVLDQFLASQEHEAEEAKRIRGESEGLKVLDIARDEIREVFDALKKELEELKEESEELKGELEALKKGGSR